MSTLVNKDFGTYSDKLTLEKSAVTSYGTEYSFRNIAVVFLRTLEGKGAFYESSVIVTKHSSNYWCQNWKGKNNKCTVDERLSRRNYSPRVNLDMSRIFSRKARKMACRNDHWPRGGSKLNNASIYFYTRLRTECCLLKTFPFFGFVFPSAC